MELHHTKHHQTYVNNYNAATEQLEEATANSNIAAQVTLKSAINFNGGGHLNHSLFWENLAPKSAGGGEPPSGALAKAIDDTYGSLEGFQAKVNASLAAVQGSGWTWLVKDTTTGAIGIKNYAVSTACILLRALFSGTGWPNSCLRTRILSWDSSSPFSESTPGSMPTSECQLFFFFFFFFFLVRIC